MEINIDTHFVHRGRFGTLTHSVVLHPDYWGIDLGEDTALMIHNGNIAKCIGCGRIIIICAKDILQINNKTVKRESPAMQKILNFFN